jgi:hypothetical protein
MKSEIMLICATIYVSKETYNHKHSIQHTQSLLTSFNVYFITYSKNGKPLIYDKFE